MFDEYRIEGKDECNEIYLELRIEQLARAIKSALTAQILKIKLTKKQGPCLTLEIKLVCVSIEAISNYTSTCRHLPNIIIVCIIFFHTVVYARFRLPIYHIIQLVLS